MDFKDIIYAYIFACGAFICRKKNELSFNFRVSGSRQIAPERIPAFSLSRLTCFIR